MKNYAYIFKSYSKLIGVGLMVFAIFILPRSILAVEKCEFERDIEKDSIGEDVRCLQKYLNSKGFLISDSGVGSVGKETTIFGEKTKDALIKWQLANDISPAGGYFGPLSRTRYNNLLSVSPVAGNNTSSNQGIMNNLPPGAKFSPLTGKPLNQDDGDDDNDDEEDLDDDNSNDSTVSNTTMSKAREVIKDAKKAFDNAEDDIDNAEDDGEDVDASRKFLDKAEDKLTDALYAFIDGEYDSAVLIINRFNEYIKDSTEDINGNEDEADEAIEDAKDAISKARQDIGEAEDDGDDVDDANDLLDEAKDKLEDARDAYDDKDYDEAIEAANDAEDLARDARDAL